MDMTVGPDAAMQNLAALAMNADLSLRPKLKTIHHFECFDADGNLKWEESTENLVTTAGMNDLLTKYFKGSSYTAAWYVGLKGSGTIAAGDTMASHSGWTEFASYSQSTRPALTLGSASSGSIDNSASQASFSITGSGTVAGAFTATDNTISGTSGTLYGASDFGTSRTVASGDTLNVTVTLSFS